MCRERTIHSERVRQRKKLREGLDNTNIQRQIEIQLTTIWTAELAEDTIHLA